MNIERRNKRKAIFSENEEGRKTTKTNIKENIIIHNYEITFCEVKNMD